MTKSMRAFTLIELLIVVAIIAILAAIAVPNFLEAQTRAKVSRVKADMRTVVTGLESYFVDNNRYPANLLDAANRRNVMNMSMMTPGGVMPFVPYTVTTPVSYISSVPLDTFNPRIMADHQHSFQYFNSTNTPDAMNRQGYRAMVKGVMMNEVNSPEWTLISTGPDRQLGTMGRQINVVGDLPIYEIMAGAMMAGGGMGGGMGGMMPMGSVRQYDSSNGTISEGDIVLFGP